MSKYMGSQFLKVADVKESGPFQAKIVDVEINEKFDKPAAAAFLHGLRFGNGDNAMSEAPVFVAVFNDDTVTRMSVYQKSAKLDFGRGVRLSRWAYCSRKRTDQPAPIKGAHYEDGETGAVLATLTSEEIAAEERNASASGTASRTS